jgi:lipopolysaccharide transport system ATP-binding protein
MLEAFGRSVPPQTIVGLLGDESSGISAELESLSCGPTGITLVNYSLDARDPLALMRAKRSLNLVRRDGGTVLLASWNTALLIELCDEVWWIEDGKVIAQAHPVEIVDRWNLSILERWRAEQSGANPPLSPAMRRGDGRAVVKQVELLDAREHPVTAWQSGEEAVVRVSVEFTAEVAQPVIGMLIRTRVGLDVYGTNTELERLELGPRAAGDRVRVSFRFACELCPGDYTLTVASHDPDGTWHEWLEDVVAFAVGDSRYTAGVANLRAKATWELRLTGKRL